MCSLLRSFLADVKTVSTVSKFSNHIEARTYRWIPDGMMRRRVEDQSFSMLDNFECTEDAENAHVSFDAWNGSKMARQKFSFPLEKTNRGTKMLRFTGEVEERFIVRDTIPHLDGPSFAKTRRRILTLTTCNESQFWGDFALIYEYPYCEMLKEETDESSYMKPYYQRGEN